LPVRGTGAPGAGRSSYKQKARNFVLNDDKSQVNLTAAGHKRGDLEYARSVVLNESGRNTGGHPATSLESGAALRRIGAARNPTKVKWAAGRS